MNTMEDDTIGGMASSLHPHIVRNPNEMVCRPRTTQRNYIMENITKIFNGHFII
jgi:hypothetical protein